MDKLIINGRIKYIWVHIRYGVLVGIPCFLIFFPFSFWNENSELFYRNGLSEDRFLEECVCMPIAGIPSNLHFSKSRSKFSSEFSASDMFRIQSAYASSGEIPDKSADTGGNSAAEQLGKTKPITFWNRHYCDLMGFLSSLMGCLIGCAFTWWGLPFIFEGRDFVPWPFQPGSKLLKAFFFWRLKH